MDDTKVITTAVKQALFEIFDEEMIAQISFCLHRIVAEELSKKQ